MLYGVVLSFHANITHVTTNQKVHAGMQDSGSLLYIEKKLVEV